MRNSSRSLLALALVTASLAVFRPAPSGAEEQEDPACASHPAPVCWTSFPSLQGDGKGPVPALLFRPTEPNGKAIVYVHGGWGATIARIRPELREALEGLAALGYVVVGPDYRGSGTPDAVGHPAGWRWMFDVGRGEVGDSAAAVTWVRADLADDCAGCDPISDVAVLGTSHGGGIVAGMAFLYPELAEGYSVNAGVSDWAALYNTIAGQGGYQTVRTQLEASMGGTPTEVPEEYAARSALFNVGPVTRPVQILHGLGDETVPPSQSTLYRDALLAAGKQVDYHAFPGSHSFMVNSQLSSPPWQTFLTWAKSVLWPDTTIGSGPPEVTNAPTAQFDVSGSLPGSSFECRLDGAAEWTACPSPLDVGPLDEGPHSIEVRASHDGEVDPQPATWSWTVDLTAPDTTIGSGPSGPTASTEATFTFSSPDPDATFRCRTDDGAWEACSSPVNLTGSSHGDHTFSVAATDPAGNEDPTPATRPWAVDTVAPDTSIIQGPPPDGPDASATFQMTATEAGSFLCSLDGGPVFECSSPWTVGPLAGGAHVATVAAVDLAGNVDPDPAAWAWRVESAPPETTIEAAPSGVVTSASASVSFSSNLGEATFECSLDGAAFAPCASPVALSGLAQGDHDFDVRAVVGSVVDETPARASWVVDTEPPDTSIDTAPTAWWASSTATFTFSATDEDATFQCRLGNAAYAPCTSPHMLTGLTAKTRTFWVRATDASGLTDQSAASWTFTVDLTAPNTTITGGPTGTVSETTATFSFTSSQTGSSFECALDAGAFAPCASPATTSGLASGGHTFRVRAIDPAGNVDATVATRTWTVGTADTSPPETSIVSGPASGTVFPATFELASTEPGSTFTCRLKSLTTYSACTSPHTVTGYPAGTYTLQVRATDPSGNLDSSPASWTWTATAAAPGSAQRR